ncbi:hypothetical protein DBV15_01835 [Temnothorax longispinosus]|uniref:Uncharacterized protein n=1 Tax=Temnothorax longispinosus TaxID=300112 RepID=A0A4S2L0I7_9HYME|nr:hypothetical protein DBV15_01835 [Temnothorax longispinosus]
MEGGSRRALWELDLKALHFGDAAKRKHLSSASAPDCLCLQLPRELLQPSPACENKPRSGEYYGDGNFLIVPTRQHPYFTRPVLPTTKPPLALQEAEWGRDERRKKYHVGRMRCPFAVRHRVMCARFATRVRTHGGEGGWQSTKKNSGVSGAGRREREKQSEKNRAGIQAASKIEYKYPARTSETKYRFHRIAKENRRKEGGELPPPLPSRQVTATAEHKDNCINLFPIRHRNSRSFGLITTRLPYHPVGLRFPIKFLEEQNARSPAAHHRSLTLLNCDLHRRITAGRGRFVPMREIFHFLFRSSSQVSFKTADPDTVAGSNLHKAP